MKEAVKVIGTDRVTSRNAVRKSDGDRDILGEGACPRWSSSSLHALLLTL